MELNQDRVQIVRVVLEEYQGGGRGHLGDYCWGGKADGWGRKHKTPQRPTPQSSTSCWVGPVWACLHRKILNTYQRGCGEYVILMG